MSSIRRKQMSGSSQGRDGNIQKEQSTNGKVNTGEVLAETAHRRMRSQEQRNSVLNENLRMMPNSSNISSGGLNRGGGKIQEELNNLVQETAQRRKQNVHRGDINGKVECKDENGEKQLEPNSESRGGLTEFTQRVDAVLVETMSKNAPHL